MEYQILLSDKAEKFLSKLDKTDKLRTINKIKELKFNPKIGKPLTANLSGLWSLRAGKYRAIYNIENNKLSVFIIKIDHRKSVYE